MTLADYILTYPCRPPRVPAQNPDENRLLAAAEGVVDVTAAPFPQGPRGTPNSTASNDARHLWVFQSKGPEVPAIQELANVTPPLQSGKAKHTNLTGGQPAACGGELWVDVVDPGLLYLNGGSGRYGPATPQALADAVKVFEARGFTVRSFGWDIERNAPARFYRGA